MQGPNANTSTKSFKQAFLKNLLLNLHALTSTSASSFDAISLHQRKRTVKSSTDVAMAAARDDSGDAGAVRWPKAILARASRAFKMRRRRRIVIRCCGRKRCLTRSRAAASSSDGGDAARRLVRRRTMALRDMIPGGRDAAVDETTLLREAMDYVVHLRAQVDMLRQVSEAVQRFSSIALQVRDEQTILVASIVFTGDLLYLTNYLLIWRAVTRKQNDGRDLEPLPKGKHLS
ncbi:transcription factor IBH1-like 1 [Lolium rigidum]|uniref:transcription factor IBH1-like 1 n=1 Tax=Lolium rigidum TaxID=89674 RepID=UPI001F5D2861|nr:transcription factor IBH1-like 1 [Lolium rigidum]